MNRDFPEVPQPFTREDADPAATQNAEVPSVATPETGATGTESALDDAIELTTDAIIETASDDAGHGVGYAFGEAAPAALTEPDAIVEGASEPWAPPAAPETLSGNGLPPSPPLPPLTGVAAEQNPARNPSEGEPAGDPESNPEDGPPMTLTEHLGELRIRLVRMLIGAGLGFLLCYGVSEQLFMWLAQPLAAVMPSDTKLIYTSVPEGFFVYLKVAFVAGVFVASPYIFYQVWAFIAPGLYREERQQVLPLALCSAFFFILGASFCYFLVFPYAFTFFMSYSTGMIVAMPSINEYLGFSLKMILAFGLIFEMPVFAFFLARMGLVTAAWMRRVRRYAVLMVFVVAAILTPPDVISQLLMAVPMLLLYEVSIFVAAAVGRKEPENDQKAEASA